MTTRFEAGGSWNATLFNGSLEPHGTHEFTDGYEVIYGPVGPEGICPALMMIKDTVDDNDSYTSIIIFDSPDRGEIVLYQGDEPFRDPDLDVTIYQRGRPDIQS